MAQLDDTSQSIGTPSLAYIGMDYFACCNSRKFLAHRESIWFDLNIFDKCQVGIFLVGQDQFFDKLFQLGIFFVDLIHSNSQMGRWRIPRDSMHLFDQTSWLGQHFFESCQISKAHI